MEPALAPSLDDPGASLSQARLFAGEQSREVWALIVELDTDGDCAADAFAHIGRMIDALAIQAIRSFEAVAQNSEVELFLEGKYR